MVSTAKFPPYFYSVLFAPRSRNGKNREIFSPRGKKKKERFETIYISRVICVTSRVYFISYPIWIMVITGLLRKIHMFSSPSVELVYSL